ncbi:MAG: hypothetical protein K1000chlam1_00187 [Candidatus Anoxychlamydiales bacterium]|nr:hypothetical protein [Candidatus Anoxychlamydiales bacterium]
MANVRVQDNQFDKFAQPIPANIEEVIGAGPSTITDFSATLGSFFKTTLYGPLNTWSGFWQKVNNRASSTSKQGRLELYNSIKGPHDKLTIAHKVHSQDEANKLKAENKNLRSYEVLKTSLSEKALEEIKSILPKGKTDSDVVISLKKIARDPNISRETRKLINQKLNEALKNKKFIEYIPLNPNYYRNLILKRVVGVIAISTILFSIYYPKIPSEVFASDEGKPTRVETSTQPEPTTTQMGKPNFWTRFQRVIAWEYNHMDESIEDARNKERLTIEKIREMNDWLSNQTDSSINDFRSFDQNRTFSNETNISKPFFNDILSYDMIPNWNQIFGPVSRFWGGFRVLATRSNQRSDELLGKIHRLFADQN